jgi:curved DNA-binding protein CbpA
VETTYATLKRCFRTLAAKHHPDHNPNNQGAAALMENLTAAYRLLATVALAQAAGSLDEDPICRFDQAAIEDTVLLGIARQEEAQSEGGQGL